MGRSTYKRMCSCGPGGRECSCCFPPSGTKPRRVETRAAEHRVRQRMNDDARWMAYDEEPEYGLGYMQGRGAA